MKTTILEKIIGGVAAVIGIIGVIVIIGLLVSWPFMLLWNGCLVGTIAGISPITSIWHAWGMLILAAFLFKGLGKSSS